MKKYSVIFIIFLLFINNIFSQEMTAENVSTIFLNKDLLPVIPDISSRDYVFKQFNEDVENNYKLSASGKLKTIQFYAYKIKKGDTLLRIAASCAIPYDTIASINSLSNIEDLIEGTILILPTVAGMFVAEKPVSSLEILIEKKYIRTIEQNKKICYNIDDKVFYFLQGERFSSTERAYFLDAEFKMPLDNAWLSSGYGMRKSPISGNMQFHQGIDLAAPEGVAVYSCKAGTVLKCVKGDSIYGNYIVLKHNNGMTSIYAHLSAIEVNQGDTVLGKSRIGLVGQTGAATGPHLHFEIRVNGVSTDPRTYIP